MQIPLAATTVAVQSRRFQAILIAAFAALAVVVMGATSLAAQRPRFSLLSVRDAGTRMAERVAARLQGPPLPADPPTSAPWPEFVPEDSPSATCQAADPDWHFQLFPYGLIYRPYLAGEKESRFRSYWAHEKDDGWIWDITLGGAVGLLRYGTSGKTRPEGFQVGLEGAGIPRLDLEEDSDLVSADFRFGIPVTYGTSKYQIKLAYYHLSSHLGDEYLLKHPGYPRLNYSRNVLVNGYSFYLSDRLRVYAEAGWAFSSDVAEPWEFQFGAEYSPAHATGLRGAPFAAIDGHLRQEVDYGGNLVVQAGWAWRGNPASGMFRMGFEYFNGKSDQFSFYDDSESKVGIGIWYDY